SFCYVSDLVAGLYKLIHSDLHDPVNLGNPIEMTLKELAIMIKKMTKSGSKIVYRPLPKDDPKQRQPDITQAREKLKWQPKVRLKTGLARTVEWFREHSI
ncbi:MAG: SDR family NAD-dependent epimerase/dehydratase, partial [Candidatus Omnitrophota bacterium]